MMELTDYKEMVFQILWDGNQVNRLMSELRMTLFYKAVQGSINRPRCLMPFPSCFFDPKTKTKRFEDLKKYLEAVPQLDDIKEETELPTLTWELLYWILTNPLTIQPVITDIKNYVQQLKITTGLIDIPEPNNKSKFLFKTLPSHPKEPFEVGKEQFGSFYAYHGSQLENFHSIIHRGFASALNVRSAHGFGTYLSSKVSLSRQYSEHTDGWSKSAIGKGTFRRTQEALLIQCVAVVEVVNHPDLKKVNIHNGLNYHVVDRDELMQLSHFLIFVK